MHASSALIRRSRLSNNVLPSTPFLAGSNARSNLAVKPDICSSCLVKLTIAGSGLHGSRLGLRNLHTSTPLYATSTRQKQKGLKTFRAAVERNKSLKSLVQKPSRMVLSDRVASPKRSSQHASAERARPKERPPPVAIERGGGMNRRTFRLRADDKQQYTREAARRQRELKEKAYKQSDSYRFSKDAQKQKPTATESTSAEEKKFSRPPVRRFAQMKHISSLNHVSNRARELTHVAEQRFNSFETFDFLPQTLEALYKDGLMGLEDIEPTPVQSIVIPKLLESGTASRRTTQSLDLEGMGRKKLQSYLIAAETGSGKTLAYVLPLMDSLKRREQAEQAEAEAKIEAERAVLQNKSWMFDIPSPPVNDRDVRVGKPRAIILVPTSELVLQVGALLKKLSYIIKLRTEMISREFSGKVIRARLFSSTAPDIVVGTPFMLDRITEANPSMLDRCSHIIVDEADSLFDRSFSPLTQAIISRAKSLEKLAMCSATIPKSLDQYVFKRYPDCERLVTAGLHAVPRRVQMTMVEVEKDPYRGNKPLACADVLNNIAKDNTEPGFLKRVVVFVNERETTTEVTKALCSKGFDAVEINRDADSRSILESFTGDKEATTAIGKATVKALVTTDLASRGVDTKNVRNVVLYDVPYTSIDFIHRLGRTGRMGRRGRAWILVDKDSNTEWVKEIRKTMFLGQSLI